MKDIVENRRRIGAAQKARLALIVLKENGVVWSLLMGLYYVTSGIAELAFKKAHAIRSRHKLPGLNSMAANKFIWNSWDWQGSGDEWTPNLAWKQSVVRTFIDPYFDDRATILEIGPGAGRWTEYLIEKCRSFVAIDISEACINECRRRFAKHANATFLVGSGDDLNGVADQSIDAIWSFDVFVHINKAQFKSYAAEFNRVLKAGGIGIIHHGGSGGKDGGWRSDATREDVRALLTDSGLNVDRQVESWLDGETQYDAGLYKDVITVFHKA